MSCSLPCPLGNSAGGRIPAGVQCLLREGRYSPESIPHCGLTTAPAPPPSTSCLLRQSPPEPLVPLRADPWCSSGQSPWCPSGQSPHSPGCPLRAEPRVPPQGGQLPAQGLGQGSADSAVGRRTSASHATSSWELGQVPRRRSCSPGHSVVPGFLEPGCV